jgi:aspyridone synthetase trans-acting enoyl reductase
MLDQKDILTHPAEVSNSGLAGVAAGADRLRKGAAAGKKLVFLIDQ